jgi:molybdate transport system regulatory protein
VLFAHRIEVRIGFGHDWKMPDSAFLKIKIQIHCGDEIAMGPGKADLLDAIEAAGSISGAGRAMGMSYRRTWLLVDVMNRCWSEPLVDTVAGGSRNKGAHITPLGQAVLQHYRSLQDQITTAATCPDREALAKAMRRNPRPSQTN